MEMVQYYPTCLVWPDEVAGATVGYEGLLNPRYIGGKMRNARGEQMVPNAQYPDHPPPRDVLMRLMFREIAAGRATPRGGLLIDLTALPRSAEESFAMIFRGGLVPFNCLRDLGVDITREPIEVRATSTAPTASPATPSPRRRSSEPGRASRPPAMRGQWATPPWTSVRWRAA